MTDHCPLCCGANHSSLQSIDTAALARAYKRQFKVQLGFAAERLDYRQCTDCGLRFFSPLATGAPEFYAHMQQFPWYYRAAKGEFVIAQRFLEPTAAVLEIGAGRGLFAQQIAVKSYMGLEFNPHAIDAARQNGIHLANESVESHAERHAGQYDIVCTFQVLEHVADTRSFLRAAIACLKSGGKLIVSVPGEDSFAAIDHWQLLNMPPHHVTRWTDACLRNIASLFALELVALEPESLEPEHQAAYARALADQAVAQGLGFSPNFIDPRLRGRCFAWRSKRLARAIAPALDHPVLRPRGQAVIAVYAKQ